MKALKSFGLSLLFFLTFFISFVSADTYKCKAADGSIFYSNYQCTDEVVIKTKDEERDTDGYGGYSYSGGSSSYRGYNSGSGSSYGSKDVSVRGYYRKDGTYVRPHTRSRPRR